MKKQIIIALVLLIILVIGIPIIFNHINPWIAIIVAAIVSYFFVDSIINIIKLINEKV